MTRRVIVGADNRLMLVTVAGQDLSGLLSERAVEAKMSYSAEQVGQFSMAFTDPDGDIVNSGLMVKGAALDYGGYQLAIATVKHSPAPGGISVRIEARSRVIRDLRKQTGKNAYGTTDVAQWVRSRVTEAGGITVAQGVGSEPISRQDGNEEESSWDVMRRLTSVKGVWCFEVDQTIYFAKPTWLAAQSSARSWAVYWNTNTDRSDMLVDYPDYEDQEDGESTQRLTMKWVSATDYALAAEVRPGHVVDYTGRIGPAAGRWLVTGVDVGASHSEPVSVTMERPIDPKVEKTA